MIKAKDQLTARNRAESVVRDAVTGPADLQRLHQAEIIAATREGLSSAERGELKDANLVYSEMKSR